MKKITASLLALIFIVTLFASCGGGHYVYVKKHHRPSCSTNKGWKGGTYQMR